MPKCDFSKVAKQFYWNRTSPWVFSCTCCIFLEHLFLRTPLDGCFSHGSHFPDFFNKTFFHFTLTSLYFLTLFTFRPFPFILYLFEEKKLETNLSLVAVLPFLVISLMILTYFLCFQQFIKLFMFKWIMRYECRVRGV